MGRVYGVVGLCVCVCGVGGWEKGSGPDIGHKK